MITFDGVTAKAAFVLANAAQFRGPSAALSLQYDGKNSVAPDLTFDNNAKPGMQPA